MPHQRPSRTPDEVTACWSELDVDAGDIGLHVYRAGRLDRPPLVFAHGLVDSGRRWWRVAAALEDDADLIMIDARHHGRSSSPDARIVAHRGPGGGRRRGGAHRPRSWATPSGRGPLRVRRHPFRCADRLVLIDPLWTADRVSDGDVRAAEREAIEGRPVADMSDVDLARLVASSIRTGPRPSTPPGSSRSGRSARMRLTTSRVSAGAASSPPWTARHC